MAKFKSLGERTSLSKNVALKIEEAILNHTLKPGEKLPSELDFCEQFGVSRTVIREALKTLSAKGLIRIEKGRGIFVEEFDSRHVTDPFQRFLEVRLEKDYVMDLVHSRLIIEPSLAELAAKNRTESDLEALRVNLQRLEEQGDKLESVAELDADFHLLVARSSKNEVLALILDPIHRLMPEIKKKILNNVESSRGTALIWHSKILTKIEEKDSIGARQAMTEHLSHASEHARKIYDKNEL